MHSSEKKKKETKKKTFALPTTMRRRNRIELVYVHFFFSMNITERKTTCPCCCRRLIIQHSSGNYIVPRKVRNTNRLTLLFGACLRTKRRKGEREREICQSSNLACFSFFVHIVRIRLFIPSHLLDISVHDWYSRQ
jgi:hypothetical protein